jgi:hypothetical protein
VAFAGGVDVTLPDATTEHWSLEGTLTGTEALVTTSTGLRLYATLAADGSGSALLENTVTGETLALVTWTADGEATIIYADGTSETVDLFP